EHGVQLGFLGLGEVECRDTQFGVRPRRAPASHADDRLDVRIGPERLHHTRAEIAGGSGDDDASTGHRGPPTRSFTSAESRSSACSILLSTSALYSPPNASGWSPVNDTCRVARVLSPVPCGSACSQPS